ncbi:hypothetical protein Hanom_Chr14g01336391 [Helianthus anomalus]
MPIQVLLHLVALLHQTSLLLALVQESALFLLHLASRIPAVRLPKCATTSHAVKQNQIIGLKLIYLCKLMET